MAEVNMKSKKKLALKGQEHVLWDETKATAESYTDFFEAHHLFNHNFKALNEK